MPPSSTNSHRACVQLSVLLLTTLCFNPSIVYAQAPAPASAEALYRSAYEAYNRGDLATAHQDFARLIQLVPKVAVGHMAYGEVLLAEGHTAAALDQLKLATTLDPKTPAAQVALAGAWLALGDGKKAADAFREAMASGAILSAQDSRTYAGLLAGYGHGDQAAAVLRAALAPPRPGQEEGQPALSPEETAMLEDALGTLLAQQGDLEQAAQHFTVAVAAAPTLAGAQAHLGSAALAQHQPEAAAAALRRAVALAPSDADYTIELGHALTALGQDAEAISVLRHAVALAEQDKLRAQSLAPTAKQERTRQASTAVHSAPGLSKRDSLETQSAAKTLNQAHYALALALQAGGQPVEALPLFAGYLADEPRNAAALTNYALALVQTGDAKHAIQLYQQALALEPADATLREDYGVAYLQQSDLDHALEQFQAGLTLEPENPHLHYDLGLAYKLKDNLHAAIPEFERAEQLDPALPDPAYTLGVIHMQQGEFAAAASELEKTVALQPGNSAAWAVLGNVYKENGDAVKAEDALRRAIALDPNQPSTHISLAAILAQGGDKDGAAGERKQAAELSRVAVSRQRASFALKSGRSLLDQGKLKEAEVQLRTAVAADPQDPLPHQALAETLSREGQSADAALERQEAGALASAVSTVKTGTTPESKAP